MRIALVAALAQNRVLGKDNQLIWHLPHDLRHFKKLTLGHPVVMGRKTYESVGRPLPGRTNIIVTHQTGYQADGCVTTHSLSDALAQAAATGTDTVFIIGGGEIYRQALPLASVLHLTHVYATPAGDAFFPEFSSLEWHQAAKESFAADERHAHAFDIVTWERRAGQPI